MRQGWLHTDSMPPFDWPMLPVGMHPCESAESDEPPADSQTWLMRATYQRLNRRTPSPAKTAPNSVSMPGSGTETRQFVF